MYNIYMYVYIYIYICKYFEVKQYLVKAKLPGRFPAFHRRTDRLPAAPPTAETPSGVVHLLCIHAYLHVYISGSPDTW